jgi:hypothetical protein
MRCRPLHRAALGALPFARCSLSAYLRTGQCSSQAAHTTSAPGLPVERIANVPTTCSQQRGVRHAACEVCVAASACTVYDRKRRRGLHGKRPPALEQYPSAKGHVVWHGVLTTHTTQPLFSMPRLTQADREGAWVGRVQPWRTRSVLQTVTWLRADASAPGTKCAEPVVASFNRRARTFMTMTARCTSSRLPFHVAPLSSPSTVPTMRVVYHMSCCMSCHVVCVPQRKDFRHTDCKDGDAARIVPQRSCGGVSDRSIVCL